MVAPTRIRHPALTGPLSLAASLAIAAASGCGASPVVTTSEGTGTVVTASVGLESVVFAALEVREHQRLAHDLYDELSRRHVEPSLRLARDSRR